MVSGMHHTCFLVMRICACLRAGMCVFGERGGSRELYEYSYAKLQVLGQVSPAVMLRPSGDSPFFLSCALPSETASDLMIR